MFQKERIDGSTVHMRDFTTLP